MPARLASILRGDFVAIAAGAIPLAHAAEQHGVDLRTIPPARADRWIVAEGAEINRAGLATIVALLALVLLAVGVDPDRQSRACGARRLLARQEIERVFRGVVTNETIAAHLSRRGHVGDRHGERCRCSVAAV